NLAEDIVHLVRAGVIKLLALEIDFCATAMLGEALGEIKRRRTAHIMGQIPIHLLFEGRIGFGGGIGLFQFEDERHQRLRDKAAAIDAKWPRSSGPVRNELSCCTVMGTVPLGRRVDIARLGHARCADESENLVRILHARSTLYAGGYIDAGG